MTAVAPWQVVVNVVCGAWAGFLIAALWYGHQELARLRGEVERMRAGGLGGGQRPLSEGTVDPPPEVPPNRPDGG